MFTLSTMRQLLADKPFVPFRLWSSDGGYVDVPTSEVVPVGKQFACIGLLDSGSTDAAADRWTTIWYLHVSRVEMRNRGQPPFASPPGPETPPAATA